MKKSLALSFALYSPDEFTAFPRPEAETKEERDKGTWNKQDREGGEKTEGKGKREVNVGKEHSNSSLTHFNHCLKLAENNGEKYIIRTVTLVPKKTRKTTKQVTMVESICSRQ